MGSKIQPQLFRRATISILLAFLFISCTDRPSVTHHGIFAPSRLRSVIGQDGVCSIKFSDSVTLWTFADTITGSWKSDAARLAADKNGAVMDGMLSNSLAWSEGITENNFKDITLNFYSEKGRAAQFIKYMPGEDPLHHRFWALDGFRSGSRLYVFYLHVYVPDHTKFLDFKVLYTGLARWDIPDGWKPGDRISFKRIGKPFGTGSPCFGAAVHERNGYLYLAGHSKDGKGSFPLSFARVKTADIENKNSYQFLTDKGEWTGRIEDAGKFFNDVSGECSLSYNESLKQYVIIYSRVLSGDVISVRFSDFSGLPGLRGEVVVDLPAPESGSMWAYSAKEIFHTGRRVFLIYINPSKYQPMLVELKY